MDNTLSREGKLNIRVVYDENDRFKALAVRTLVYMAEQNCPYHEEFDLNDYSSTHILGSVDEEPVLTGRIRYFGDFAKLERLAVRRPYRGLGYGKQLLSFMINFCISKGYRKIYLHAQEGKEGFYSRYGFKEKNEVFSFSGYRYSEMLLNIENNLSSLILDASPMLLNRPEGRWSRPGPLEAPPFQQPIAMRAFSENVQL